MVEIRTKRLLLRPARESDLPAFHDILSDARATAYWSTPPHADLAQTEKWVASMIAIPPEDGEDFVIEHEGRLIGKAGMFRFPEIGYILHPDSWGNGFAREALEAVLDRAFAVHRLPAIEADIDPRNERSLKLLAGLGFVEVGRGEATWLVDGRWCDSIYMRLTAPADC